MITIKNFALYLSLVFLLSCKPGLEEKLPGVWKLTWIEDPKLTTLGETLDGNFSGYMGNVTDNFFGFSYLNLLPDSEFALRMGSVYLNGKWNYDKDLNRIILTYKDKNEERQMPFLIQKFEDEEITLMIDTVRKHDNIKTKDALDDVGGEGFSEYIKTATLVCSFKKDNFQYTDTTEDIYSISNNNWRVKPSAPETREQMKVRLKASINSLILYFNNIRIRDFKTINKHAYDIFSPIKVAHNGIALKNENDLPSEWKDIFFNESQALEANKLLVNAFSLDIEINEYENWIDLDIDLLKQILREIK
jgi:hypothetical protein